MATYGTGVYGGGTYGTLSGDPVTYEKTGVAVAGSRAAGVREGGTGVVVLVAALSVREKPPLRVKIDIQTPGGKHYRWAEDEPSPENVPSGLRWSDTMPGGFETMDCVLPRKPGIDYADLEQLSTIRVLGASGDIAGEYRLERVPRTSGDEVSVSPGAVGWQAHLEDDKSARELYIDRELQNWTTPPSRQRVVNLSAASPSLKTSMGQVEAAADQTLHTLRLSMNRLAKTATDRGFAETWYDAKGLTIGQVQFDTATRYHAGAPLVAGWELFVRLSDDDVATSSDSSVNMIAGGANAIAASVPNRKWARVSLDWTGVDATVDGEWIADVRNLQAFGNYVNMGLTLRGSYPDQGFYASDIVWHAVTRYAPLLTTDIQQSSFIIPHAVFFEPTTGGEIIRQATRFGLQDWAVWDNKTFWWHNRGTFAKRWRSRVAPAQLDETGPQVDRLWESIIVSYQDVDGSTRTVGPPGSGADTEDAVLKDDDPDNPANQLGIVRRDVLSMGVSTAAGATEVGRRFLEQAKVLDRSGRARLVGHVEDDRGVLHPYWRPRAGDYISFLDASDSSYRRIVKTDKDHSARTCGLDLDAPPEGLQALLGRLGVVLVPLGLG